MFHNKKNVYFEANNDFGNLDEKTPKSDFPLMPLYADGQFTEQMVQEQVDILLFGHETTATALAYAILMLAIHPNIQQQVFDELHSKYDAQEQETTYEKMQSFELLDRVIKETTRLFPSVFLFSRTPSVDIPLKNCVIPKGVNVLLPVYTLHRVNKILNDKTQIAFAGCD